MLKKLLITLGVVTLLNDSSAQVLSTHKQVEAGQWLAFRADIDLEKTPRELEMRIAADSKYWLWVNGELQIIEGGLKRGPNPKDTYVDILGEGTYNFQAGENTVAVLVWYFGREGFSHRSSPVGGMDFEMSVDGKELSTDDLWRVKLHPALRPTIVDGAPNYRLPESNIDFDARVDFDFASVDFDDSEWEKPRVISLEEASWNALAPRPIPQWRDYGMKTYEKIEKTDSTVVGHLPYNAHITPSMKINAPEGLVIDIRTENYRGGSDPNVYARYTTRGGEQSFECLGWMNGHQVIYTIPEGVEVLEVGYRETGYDSDFAGSFVCDDQDLNALWQKAQRTLYVTMRDTYMDCPDRERAQWWGDVVNELGESFYALDERSWLLTRKAVRELMDWQREDGTIYSPVPAGNWGNELPMQMLASVSHYGFWTYYMGSGDSETIEYVFPKVKKYLDVWQLDSEGFVVPRSGGWTWGDWGDNKDMYLMYQLWYVIALKGYEQMAQMLGDDQQAAWAVERAAKIRENFHTKFWVGTHYKSPEYNGQPDDRSQALAVVSGIAPEGTYPTLRKFFTQQFHASPYMEKYVLEALCTMGYYQDAMDRMKLRYQSMINSPLSTLWEGWGIGGAGFGGGSYNHAWSGGPLTILSSYMAGITTITPEFETFSVSPNMANLSFIECVVPLSGGRKISTSITKDASQCSMSLDVPKGTQATVVIPDGYSQMWVNGKKSSEGRTLKSGTWEILFK